MQIYKALDCIPLRLVLFLGNSGGESNIPGRHSTKQPGTAGKFCLRAGNRANKRVGGTMGRCGAATNHSG